MVGGYDHAGGGAVLGDGLAELGEVKHGGAGGRILAAKNRRGGAGALTVRRALVVEGRRARAFFA